MSYLWPGEVSSSLLLSPFEMTIVAFHSVLAVRHGQMFVTGLSCKFLELDLALVFSPKQLCFLVGNDIS